MQKTFLIMLALSISLSHSQDFTAYVHTYKKKFANQSQRAYRQQLYNQKWKLIHQTNSQNLGYTLGENQFTDRTEQQASNMAGLQKMPFPPTHSPFHIKNGKNHPHLKAVGVDGQTPLQVDWRLARGGGKVTSIKEQGACGCCWAFTTTAQYQSILMIGGMTTQPDLSEEYILQCTTAYQPTYTSDCSSGFPDFSVPFALSKGIPTQQEFPYLAKSTHKGKPTTPGICQTTNQIKDTTINAQYVGNHFNATNDEMKTLVSFAPVIVLVYANPGFQHYKSGIYSGCPNFNTSVKNINHAVLLIGYDQDGNYIIKNSWGTTWGENGYGTVSKDADCGFSFHPIEMIGNNAALTDEQMLPISISQNTSNGTTKFGQFTHFFMGSIIISLMIMFMF